MSDESEGYRELADLLYRADRKARDLGVWIVGADLEGMSRHFAKKADEIDEAVRPAPDEEGEAR